LGAAVSGGSEQSRVRRGDDHRLIPPVPQRQRRGQMDAVELPKGVALDQTAPAAIAT
jgi:hypothetical protein